MSIEQKLHAKLRQRGAEGNRRHLSLARSGAVDFCSNDYLGLARSTELRRRIQAAYEALPEASNGATGSRLISGHSALYEQLETKLARLFGAEKTLVFNSGYAANAAVLSAVPQRGDTILYDEYIHASLKEGARLSFAARFAFRHNDLDDLDKKLRRATGDAFVVVESVYSMDGDAAPLRDLLDVCERHGAHLVWDEAHSTGLWGTGGSGVACAQGLAERVFARVYTFGKAMGVHGACVAGPAVLADYLVNFARPFIYTTALPAHSLVSIGEAFNFLAEHPEWSEQLHRNVRFFRSEAARRPVLAERFVPSGSPIQAFRIGGNEATRQLANRLQSAGFDVRPILSPTVKAGEERLRICLHAYNTEAEISGLIQNCEFRNVRLAKPIQD